MVGQWSVNHRHGVMTRLSFQRLHRRKSSVQSAVLCFPLHHGAPSLSFSLSTSPSDRSVSSPAGIDTMAPGIRRILR